MLQIMTDKGLVVRDETSRAHVYEATLSRESTQMGLLQDLLDKAFDGSAQRLVMRALTEAKTSPEELAEIRKLLDELEGEQS
jgi:predicted transcriptional regulator